jgi:ABC-type multidrug transport system ATPase subunit
VGQNGTVGVIGYGVDFFATDQREIAFKKWIKDNRPDITVKEAQFHDPSEAKQVAADFLAANPELEGLFVVWDEPALAAASAAREAGKALPITTVDLGQEAAMTMAGGGPIKGVGAQLPYDQGVAEVLVAMNALLGKQPPPWIALPAVAVTPKNLLEAYEKVWHAAPSSELVEAGRSGAESDSIKKAPATDGHDGREVQEQSPLLELRDVRNNRLRGLNLAVAPGEIVGLAGMLGSGRTEVLETIFGLRRVTSGEMRLSGKPVVIRDPPTAIRHGIAFVPEDRHQQGLVLSHSIERNVALPRLPQLEEFGFFRRAASVARAESAMRELSVKAPSPSSLVGNLSGGNQQKVVFGKWREPSPTLLLLDEPTAGVDVGARGEIYDVIHRMAGLGSAVLAVSSEFAELLLLCDRIGIVANGRVVKELARSEIENEEHLHRLVQEASQE